MSRSGRKKRRGRWWQSAGKEGPVALRDLADSHLASIINMLETGEVHPVDGRAPFVLKEEFREELEEDWLADMKAERDRRAKSKHRFKGIFG